MTTTTLPNDMIQTVIKRANEMLKDSEISKIYNSFSNEDIAKNWITKMAIATLVR